MAEFKSPKNPHSFRKGAIFTLGGALAMAGGFWAVLKGNETMDRSIGYDEGVGDGIVAMAEYSRDLIKEAKEEVDNGDNEEESP